MAQPEKKTGTRKWWGNSKSQPKNSDLQRTLALNIRTKLTLSPTFRTNSY